MALALRAWVWDRGAQKDKKRRVEHEGIRCICSIESWSSIARPGSEVFLLEAACEKDGSFLFGKNGLQSPRKATCGREHSSGSLVAQDRKTGASPARGHQAIPEHDGAGQGGTQADQFQDQRSPLSRCEGRAPGFRDKAICFARKACPGYHGQCGARGGAPG
ncbi:MAG: hypothetical protein JOZ58_24875 [Acetobacteraceae bacterium]|nr:hypothetical protein [Acetobacteraceae bacterium]